MKGNAPSTAASAAFEDADAHVFSRIVFMKFFERPAEASGTSLKVQSQYTEVANRVFQTVVNAIKPTAVVFVSSKASPHAKAGGLHAFLKTMAIGSARTPHPATAWWHRASHKYGGLTDKAHFIAFARNLAA